MQCATDHIHKGHLRKRYDFEWNDRKAIIKRNNYISWKNKKYFIQLFRCSTNRKWFSFKEKRGKEGKEKEKEGRREEGRKREEKEKKGKGKGKEREKGKKSKKEKG